MNIIVRVKQVFRKNKGCFEVWDTSAMSNWLDKFIEKVNGKNNIILVVPEGVVHELSVGRHRFERARNAYEYIKNVNSTKVIKEVTDDKIRSWTIDEQVIDVVWKYYKKGYNVRLVTCDQDQAYKAEIKKLKCTLLKGIRTQQMDKQPKEDIQKVNSIVKPNRPTIFPTELKGELTVPYKRVGKENFIDVKTRIAVYDNRGKRKIGKAEMISIRLTDTFVYKNITYRIAKMEHNILTLKRENST